MTRMVRLVDDILPAVVITDSTRPYATYPRARLVLSEKEVLLYVPHNNRAELIVRRPYTDYSPPSTSTRGLGKVTLDSGEVWEYRKLRTCGCHDVLGAVPLGADLAESIE